MTKKIKPIPDGYHTATPSLCVQGAAQAIEFYKKAFGAKELMRMPGPEGKITHAKIQIGDSILFISDEFPEMPNSCRAPQTLRGISSAIYLYVQDVDVAYTRAINAGGKPLMPITDMFWGDRYGQILDPFGHLWALATHKEDLSPEEIAKRQMDFFAAASK